MALPATRSDTAPQTREPWDPFREFSDLQRQMNQLLDSVWSTRAAGDGAWSPLVDIEETDDAWTVEADLPGVKKDNIHLDASDSELVITGEISERERKGTLRRRTRRTGRFEYRVTLPGDVDTGNIDASLSDGVLTVRIPKPERAKPRQVEIKS
jgi:HSP20 family protein